MKEKNKFILASGSPRRKQILEKDGFSFEIYVPNVTEETKNGALETVVHNARLKAEAAAKVFPDCTVIAADTVVSLENKILEKPKDIDEATEMLQYLSGKTHKVYTAVALAKNGIIDDFYDESTVTFKSLSLEDIGCYFNHCKPLDKAGAYNIDEGGEIIIDYIKGSYENIMGFPIVKFKKIVKNF